MSLGPLSLPENWDSTDIDENIGFELSNIIRLLIAKTKLGEIEWKILDQTEDRFILPCNKEEKKVCYECEIFGNRVCIEIVKKFYCDSYYHYVVLRTDYISESYIQYDSSTHIMRNSHDLINMLNQTIKDKINNSSDSSLKLFKRAQEFRKLLES